MSTADNVTSRSNILAHKVLESTPLLEVCFFCYYVSINTRIRRSVTRGLNLMTIRVVLANLWKSVLRRTNPILPGRPSTPICSRNQGWCDHLRESVIFMCFIKCYVASIKKWYIYLLTSSSSGTNTWASFLEEETAIGWYASRGFSLPQTKRLR